MMKWKCPAFWLAIFLVVSTGLDLPERAEGAAVTPTGYSNRDLSQEQEPFRAGELLVRLEPTDGTADMERYLAGFGAQRANSLMDGDIEIWQVPDGQENTLAAEITAFPGVQYAEPNYLVWALGIPNDPDFSKQWGHAQMDSSSAWDIITGSDAVTIAVIDTGIDESHPELAGKLVPGHDFIDRDDLPHDLNGHGTFVAGIAAAQGNNGMGVAGVSWGARIMPLRVLDDKGEGDIADVIAALDWAREHGAKIANLSLGTYFEDPALQEAVSRVYAAGVLVVAASGNDNNFAPMYPAAFEYVLNVGASTLAGERAPYSNFGYHLDVLAPGGEGSDCKSPGAIYSTMPTYAVSFNKSRGCSINYASLSGTSFAAPSAAGLAALVWSVNPGLSPMDVTQVITSTASEVGKAGKDFYNGYGRINALGAVRAAVPGSPPWLMPIANPEGDGTYRVNWAVVPDAASYILQEDNNPGFTSPAERYSGPKDEFLVTGRPGGLWFYRVRAKLADGETGWSLAESAGVLPSAPVLDAIANESRLDEYTLHWSAVDGADDYLLETADNPNFNPAQILYHGTELQYHVTGQPGGTWVYRVKANNIVGSGGWSETRSTVVDSSGLPSPFLQLMNTGGTRGYWLDWNDIEGATDYLVEWSRDPYFSHPEPEISVIESRFTPLSVSGGAWYVRVRAAAEQAKSSWSNRVAIFRVALPLIRR